MADFRARLTRFVEVDVPRAMAGVEGERPRGLAFRGALHAAGLAGLSVPREFGGQGLDEDHEQLYAEVAAGSVLADDKMFFLGVNIVLPTLIALGEDTLAAELGPKILSGETAVCQLFSEPEAGSDLAGVRSKAVRADGGWIISGQKVWTSYGHICDLGILLARTDPTLPKHQGLTMFLVDMRAPGMEVRPLRQMTGDSEFNEVFLDGVFVPDSWVVGEVSDGWKTALAVLGRERLAVAKSGENALRRPLPVARLVEAAARGGILEDSSVQGGLVDAWLDERTAALVARRIARRAQAGEPLGPETSLGKLLRTRNGLRVAKLAAEFGFDGGLAWTPDATGEDYQSALAFELLNAPGMAMGGGTDDIQRTTIGERILGLPREPAPDRGQPFAGSSHTMDRSTAK